MKISDWKIRRDKIIEFFDTIDLKSEMTEEEEDLYDFMERLESKYSIPYEISHSLFDEINSSDFMDYLNKRYGRYCVVETARRYIWKPE